MSPESLRQLISKARRQVRIIEPKDLFSRLADVVLIDVRENREMLAGYLPGALNVPRGSLEFDADSNPVLQCRDREIVVYSNRGDRSLLAAHTLKQLGFMQVASLDGGLDRWQEQDLPVE